MINLKLKIFYSLIIVLISFACSSDEGINENNGICTSDQIVGISEELTAPEALTRNNSDSEEWLYDSYSPGVLKPLNPSWGNGQTTTYKLENIDGNEVIAYNALNFTGVEPRQTIDISEMTHFNITFKTTAENFRIKLDDWGENGVWEPENNTDNVSGIFSVSLPANKWYRLHIPIDKFDGLTKREHFGVLVLESENQSSSTIKAWVDNIYFSKETEASVPERIGQGDDTEFTTLVWSDEFNDGGSPDSSKWSYDIGTGNWGWGNGEAQYYTNKCENVRVEDGLLKITAKQESFANKDYTSGRLNTKGKFRFQYGRVEVRAKLPAAEGTWPAIWMLGDNKNSIGWPDCGEIDIVEQKGDDKDKLLFTTHFGAGSDSRSIPSGGSASTEFHVYGIEWTSDEITFMIDGMKLQDTYKKPSRYVNRWPFDAPQYLLLNIAVGGSLGGNTSGFTESSMEIDYVRVYQ